MNRFTRFTQKWYCICTIAFQAVREGKCRYAQPSFEEYNWKDGCRGERYWGSENEWNFTKYSPL